ncbi:MAG: dipeptidase [Limnochordia bacterium]
MIIFDGHIDTLLQMLHSGKNLSDSEGHVSLEKLIEGRVSAQIFAVFVEPVFCQGMALHRGLEMIDLFWGMLAENPEALGFAGSGSAVRDLHKQGKVACMLAVEGGEVLQGSLAHLRTLYRLGVRILTLTWNYRNALGNGQAEGTESGGLSPFGRAVVKEMNRLGMLIDVSHLNEPGFWDVLELSEAPVIASHSCARVLRDHPRNLTDDQIRAIAAKGGVIGVNFYPGFLTEEGEATLDDVINHIEHFIAVGGEDCVGLGSDFDGIDSTPGQLADCSTLPRIAHRLAERGWPRELIAKVMGENFLRITERVLG